MSVHEREGTRIPSAAVESERRCRLLMDSSESDVAHRLFRESFDLRFPTATAHASLALKAYDFACRIDYRHGQVPARIYLNHPLRVASIVAKEVPNVSDETVAIALLHSVYEVSQVSAGEVANLFGAQVASAITALTIARDLRDRDYLKEYYSRIEATSRGCAIVKVADKLDNIYMLCFNPSRDTRSSYLEEIDEWVTPLASRVAPPLETRLKEASAVMSELGFLNRQTELEKARKDARI